MKHLGQLKVGQSGRILSINVGKATVGQRLMAMGVLPGQLVKVINVAPLGDPIIVMVGHITVSMRRKDASCVRIETDVTTENQGKKD